MEAYWLEQISNNFLICSIKFWLSLHHRRWSHSCPCRQQQAVEITAKWSVFGKMSRWHLVNFCHFLVKYYGDVTISIDFQTIFHQTTLRQSIPCLFFSSTFFLLVLFFRVENHSLNSSIYLLIQQGSVLWEKLQIIKFGNLPPLKAFSFFIYWITFM